MFIFTDQFKLIFSVLKDLKGQISANQAKTDKLDRLCSLHHQDIENLKISINQLKKVAIAHAERVDAQARFLGIDYIDKTETIVTKEYKKLKTK